MKDGDAARTVLELRQLSNALALKATDIEYAERDKRAWDYREAAMLMAQARQYLGDSVREAKEAA